MLARKQAPLKPKKYLAKLADKQGPCAFCGRTVDEETTYGKLYSIGEIYCHYFCTLLSCCIIQKGKDEEGLFGFLYQDILAEIKRSKKHKCSYCSRVGATLGCSVSQCRKQFHLPCGREKHVISLFFGNYKSFCKDHAPKQKIPDVIMCKAKVRMARERKKQQKSLKNLPNIKEEILSDTEMETETECVCFICYEAVDGFPTTQTFWPPCCARDAWFHRSCLERMALSAGVHYLKCPLCNDKEIFYEAVLNQGYYVPDRDAAWELEQNAFSDMYERSATCVVEECMCPMGRDHDADYGPWCVQLCVLCGGAGAHTACASEPRVCTACEPAAPCAGDLAALAATAPPPQSQSTQRRRAGPVMPCRMSLRRTKARILQPSTSQNAVTQIKIHDDSKSLAEARQELNLKAPKRMILQQSETQNVGDKLLSPLKLLKQELLERISKIDGFELDRNVLDEVRDKFKRPKPLVVKKKIINDILERIVNNVSMDNIKVKEPLREWNSPKKCFNDKENVFETYTEHTEGLTEDKFEMELCEIENHSALTEDSDSNSTFQLPSEFIADHDSDQSLPIFDTPKKLRTVDIVRDAMEISENGQTVNIDVVKVDTNPSPLVDKNEKCSLKFSTYDKEVLEKNNLDIDVESFKQQYLNELDRLRNYTDSTDSKKPPKRKLPSPSVASKRRKTTDMVETKTKKIKRRRKRNKTEVSISNKNIKLKIRFRNENLKVRISNPKKKNIKKDKSRVLKQYVLKYFDNETDSKVICKPDKDFVPIKKKILKFEKSPDNLKQTSIESFFKSKPN